MGRLGYYVITYHELINNNINIHYITPEKIYNTEYMKQIFESAYKIEIIQCGCSITRFEKKINTKWQIGFKNSGCIHYVIGKDLCDNELIIERINGIPKKLFDMIN